MTTQKATTHAPDRKATRTDVQHMLGDVDDALIVEILAASPSVQDLSDAAIWTRGDGDWSAREHQELGAGALAVAEILTRNEEAVGAGQD